MKKMLVWIVLAAACSSEANNVNQTDLGFSNDVNDVGIIEDVEDSSEDVGSTYIDWEKSSHSNDIKANYKKVFDEQSVLEIRLEITPKNYAAMQDEMVMLGGELGAGRGLNPSTPPQEFFDACVGLALGEACTASIMGTQIMGDCFKGPFANAFCRPEGSEQPDMGGDLIGDPSYVEADLIVDDHRWKHVGMRYKGNSSLSFSWSQGVLKLPFKLDFDEFEDDYPEIDNQRFYGFKKLTFASGFNDATMMRDALILDLLSDQGVPAPRYRFVNVVVDFGKGPVNYGLYTMIENPAGAMVERVMGSSEGNVYKPEGEGADWTTFNEKGFKKKNNKKAKDWSDIQAAFMALHADRSDALVWREGLEKSFDAPAFIDWLAVNTYIGNWDAYGRLAHNYYLYSDENTKVLHWIPWDHNEGLKVENAAGLGNAPEMSLDEIDESWPLIRFLLDDPFYKNLYLEKLEKVSKGLGLPSSFKKRVKELETKIGPFVAQERAPYTWGVEGFSTAVGELGSYIETREALSKALLAN